MAESDARVISEKVVLVNIGREWHEGLTPEQLYERTHGYWACNPNYHDAEYAFAVAKGIVREVYKIRGWKRIALDGINLDETRINTDKSSVKTRERWEFDADIAVELRHYVGTSVARYRKHGNANPLIWVNCSAKSVTQAGIVDG
jgi:hypothetical protein